MKKITCLKKPLEGLEGWALGLVSRNDSQNNTKITNLEVAV